MYKGFMLKDLKHSSLWSQDESFNKTMKSYSNDINYQLTKILNPTNGKIKATELENEWFPSIKADIFLSHSHQDEKLAIEFANFLYSNYRINTFIDSLVWNCADDLLRGINEQYSKTAPNLYDYTKTINATTHVNIILSTALTKMMDKTECLIFLNTKNSVSVSESINDVATYSPWIYHEISTSNKLKITTPERHSVSLLKENSHTFKAIDEDFTPLYQVPVNHLNEVDGDDLINFFKSEIKVPHNPQETLDRLYLKFCK